MNKKRPSYLGDFAQGRDNNFNLMRMAAALAVLVSHSYPLAMGHSALEPLKGLIGKTLGEVAVDLFFIISGFLVASSLYHRKNTIDFLWARVLRVYPALLVMLLLTVFGLGACITSLPVGEYLASWQVYKYFAKCATLIAGALYELPGVFTGNPYKNAVNGSLWTMPYEVRMYAILLVSWLVFRLMGLYRQKVFEIAIVCAAAVALVAMLCLHFMGREDSHFLRFFYMFFSGSAFYVLRERIRLSGIVFGVFAVGLAASVLIGQGAFGVVYLFTAAYVWLYLAYAPSGVLRVYNQLGDYSYGVYIYAFPVQQTIAALIPGVSVASITLLAAPVTIFWAVLSWKFVERYALSLKVLYASHTRRLMAIRRRPA
ncbi:MAG: acyltransferase [Proteobacteria bacterium]|nr:acyltransferase [Pseudomonadota bacterium]